MATRVVLSTLVVVLQLGFAAIPTVAFGQSTLRIECVPATTTGCVSGFNPRVIVDIAGWSQFCGAPPSPPTASYVGFSLEWDDPSPTTAGPFFVRGSGACPNSGGCYENSTRLLFGSAQPMCPPVGVGIQNLANSWFQNITVSKPGVGTSCLCSVVAPDHYCGDFSVDFDETCDDGNLVDGDGCESDCSSLCANGIVDLGEECDDGNTRDGDCCSAECLLESLRARPKEMLWEMPYFLFPGSLVWSERAASGDRLDLIWEGGGAGGRFRLRVNQLSAGLCHFDHGWNTGFRWVVMKDGRTLGYTRTHWVNVDGGADMDGDGKLDVYNYTADLCHFDGVSFEKKVSILHQECDYPIGCALADGRKALSDPDGDWKHPLPTCVPGPLNCEKVPPSEDPPLGSPETEALFAQVLDEIADIPESLPPAFARSPVLICDVDADGDCDADDHEVVSDSSGLCAGEIGYSSAVDVDGDWCATSRDADLLFPTCGDGVIAFGEDCDDRNSVSGDGCDAECDSEQASTNISARTLKVFDSLNDRKKRKVSFKTTDQAIDLPAIDSDNSPISAGGSFTLYNAVTGEEEVWMLPRLRWEVKDSGLGLSGYRYRDAINEFGPCQKVDVKSGSLKLSCKGDQIDFSLNEAMQGSLVAVVQFGQQRYCAQFGGVVRMDAGISDLGKGVFTATEADAPVDCPSR